MEITVVGASRGTGAEVVRQAVAAGHQVRAVSRSGSASGDAITPFALDATDAEALRPAVAGADAVIVTVGGGQTSRADVTRAVIAAMTAEGVRRVVAQSSYGVGDSYDSMPFVVKRVVMLFSSGRSQITRCRRPCSRGAASTGRSRAPVG